MTRTAEITRTTKETDVRLALALDGSGSGRRATGVGFLDHMLDLLARHGRLDLDVEIRGDLETGAHHTAEDAGLALGQALHEALGDRAGIHRYGHAVVPMDETLAVAAIDLGGRPHATVDLKVKVLKVGDLQTELVHDFFEGFAIGARANVHVNVMYGRSSHHQIEAVFKAFARALRTAIAIDPTETGVPSTKGTLTA